MSDYRVISGVTQALALAVQRAVSGPTSPVSHATVTTQRPDKPTENDHPRVNIYLFHAAPNANLRNLDVPTWSGEGLVQQPILALDLHYLLSFYGNEERAKLDGQLLMGLTLGALHAHPQLSPSAISEMMGDDTATSVQHPVMLTTETLSVHELSRLWQTFPQVPLVLSSAVRATSVLIAEPVQAPPVRTVKSRHFDLTQRPVQTADPAPSPLETSAAPEASEQPEGPSNPVGTVRFTDRFRALWGRR